MSDTLFAPIPISQVMRWDAAVAEPLLRANRPDQGGDADLRHLSAKEIAAAKVPRAHRAYLRQLVASYQQGNYATLPAGRLRFRSSSFDGHSNVALTTRNVVITAAPRLTFVSDDPNHYFVTLLNDDASPTHTVRVQGPEEKKSTWAYEGKVSLEGGGELYVRMNVPKQRLDDGDIDILVRSGNSVWSGRSLRGCRAVPEY